MNKTAFLSAIFSSERSRFFTLIACVFLMGTLACSAVHTRNVRRAPEGNSPDQILAAMKSRLGLTADQEARIRPILEDEFLKRRAIIEKYQGQGRQGRSPLRDELQQLRSTTEQRLEPILTKGQMDEYRKMLEEARRNIRGGGHGTPRGSF